MEWWLCLWLVAMVAICCYCGGWTRSPARLIPFGFALGIILGCMFVKPTGVDCLGAVFPVALLSAGAGYFDRRRSEVLG